MLRRIILAAILAVAVSSCTASASVKVGALAKLNSDSDEYSAAYRTSSMWKHLSNHSDNDKIEFYDTLMSMLMALGAGDIDEIDLPSIVGAYVINSRPDYKIQCIVRSQPQHLVFGFLKDRGEDLRDKFNEALKAIKAEGKLDEIRTKYLTVDGTPESVKFEQFGPYEGIRVAVTGDLPPIDYVAPDGQAAGFNTALLAEIAKHLKTNIKLVYVNSGARSSALVSGRADVVFWYQLTEGSEKQYDVPDSVIVSDPYYDWDRFTHLSQSSRYADE